MKTYLISASAFLLASAGAAFAQEQAPTAATEAAAAPATPAGPETMTYAPKDAAADGC